MLSGRLPDRDGLARGVVGAAGLAAVVLGLLVLRASDELGFTFGGAMDGVLGQLGMTVPAAGLVLAAFGLELAAGLVLARAVRHDPFSSVAETALAAFAAVVVKDALLLGLLGGFGLLRAPILIGVDVAIVALAFLPASRDRLRPLTATAPGESLGPIRSAALLALVLLVWSAPVVLQLASPVVPFIDVLPNYVAPAEHVRTFGWFEPLGATQSPIIGPSRNVLGYVALLGELTAITGLPATLAVAAFALPLTLLLAASAQRLAEVLDGGSARLGPWVLLVFALTQPFARLADARGTVVVFPLALYGLALLAERLTAEAEAAHAERGAWRAGRGLIAGVALGGAILVHPVIGFFAVATVTILALAQPTRLAVDALVAGGTAAILALPQLGTMIGWTIPTPALAGAVGGAVVVGVALDRWLGARSDARDGLVRFVLLLRWPIATFAAVVFAGAAVLGGLRASRLPEGLASTGDLLVTTGGVALAALVVGWLVGNRAARSPVVLVGIVVGLAATLAVHVLPAGLGFLGDALRFEVPKTVDYWIPALAAVGAGPALGQIWAEGRVPGTGWRRPWLARVGLVGAFVVAAALPIRPAEIDAYHLGEHRWSESLAISLHFAESGFWRGYPDSRAILDPPRREIADAVRAEIDSGRLRHDTEVLHVARSFQQWVSTPLGVFDGVMETHVDLEPEVSHQTVGGRLRGFEDLPALLAAGRFAYVVLEPDGVPGGTREMIVSAGYRPIFSNRQGEVLTRD